MKVIIFFYLFFVSCLQANDPTNSEALKARKPLSLSGAIEQGLRKNYNEVNRKYNKLVLDYDWLDARDSFWLPQLTLSMVTEDQRLARLRRGDLFTPGTNRTASGSLTLGFSDYTLFNWGKDYLDYLNNKGIYTRGKNRLGEQRRALKFQVIAKYFELDYLKKVLNSYRTQLRHTSFVYRYSREKVSLRKIGKQQYYQSRSEYLKAQNDYRTAKLAVENAHEALALLIADPSGTKYLLKNTLSFKPLTFAYDHASKLSQQRSPQILDSLQDLENANRSYKKLKLDNLPLPTFKVNFGAYKQGFGQGVNTLRYTNGDGNHIDVVASINASWAITGTGGAFNGRNIARGLTDKRSMENKLAQARHQTQAALKTHYNRIKNYEGQIKVLEKQVETNSKTFDITLDNFLDRKTPYINFQDTLLELIQSEITHARMLYLHSFEKLALAQSVGLDEFPGQSFESLAVEATK